MKFICSLTQLIKIQKYSVFLIVFTTSISLVLQIRSLSHDSKELTSSSLQSPDDIDATFRNKRGNKYHGQVVNTTETANPQNQLNLITDVAVEPNNTDDSTILNKRIDQIKAKYSELSELHTDGAYGSSENDMKMNKHSINHIQTAVRGRTAEVSMNIEIIEENQYMVSCPLQSVKSKRTKTRFKACFDLKKCNTCKHSRNCPAIIQNNYRVFYFTSDMAQIQKRIHSIELLPPERRKIRPNIEATVKEYTMSFNHKGKLRIRGKFKTMLFAFAMSIGINFGRIFRHVVGNPHLFPDFFRLYALILAFIRSVVARNRGNRRCFRVFYAKNVKEQKLHIKCQVFTKMAF